MSFINLLTVQRTNAQSRIAYLDALESLRVAEAQMEGLLLDGSLSNHHTCSGTSQEFWFLQLNACVPARESRSDLSPG